MTEDPIICDCNEVRRSILKTQSGKNTKIQPNI